MWDMLFAAIFIICIVFFQVYGFCYFLLCAGIAKAVYMHYGLNADEWMMVTVITSIAIPVVLYIISCILSCIINTIEQKKLNAMTDKERKEYLKQKQGQELELEKQREQRQKQIEKEQKEKELKKRKMKEEK